MVEGQHPWGLQSAIIASPFAGKKKNTTPAAIVFEYYYSQNYIINSTQLDNVVMSCFKTTLVRESKLYLYNKATLILFLCSVFQKDREEVTLTVP